MSAPASVELPEAVLRVARLAPVPMVLRAIFSRLPEPLALDVEVGGMPEALPLAARQLLKLGLLGEKLWLRSATLAPPPGVRLTVSRADRSWSPTKEELDRGITWLAQRLLESLFAPGESSALLQSFAFQSASLATLRTITNFMLQSTDVDQALYVLLSGITSGYSLGFNRAALFVWDGARRAFVGSKAIGPYDDGEAHRIWEAIEVEDKDIEALIHDYANRNFDTRFQQFVHSVTLFPGAQDEVAQALASDQPVLLRKAEPDNRGLRALSPGGEFVLAALKPHGKTLGLILADNRFNRAPVLPDQLAYLAFFIDQTALVWENLALLKSVEELARVDSLTGIFNRRELEARLALELARCQRHERPCSVLIADVDLFKQVNDSRGHEAGDEVLKRVGLLLKQATRADDVVARFGGDEFVVVMPEAAREQIVPVARRIGLLAAEQGISVSVGGASWPSDVGEPAELLGTADRNLYRAKHAGRGCACFPGLEPIRFG